MPTIKDIAREAGVSQGTVSNVLNGKNNVSSDKILLVEQAAAKLGYTINQRAKILRKGSSNLLAVILPNIKDPCYNDFFLSFKRYAEEYGYNVSLFLSDGLVQKELIQLENIRAEMATGVAAFSCLSGEYKDAYREIGLKDENVIYVERRPIMDGIYVGFEYCQAGKEIGKKIKQKSYKKITVVVETTEFYEQKQFVKGFNSVFAADEDVEIQYLQTDMTHCYKHYLQLIRKNEPDVVVFSKYILAQRFKDIVNSLLDHAKIKIYSISSLFTMPVAGDENYELNYRFLGKTAAKRLIFKDTEVSRQIVLKNDGFGQWTKKYTNKENKTLTVLTLDSPTAQIMEDLAKLYYQATGIEVKIAISPYDSIYELLNNMGETVSYDIIRLDHTWLKGFAHKIFYPLEKLDPQISKMFDTFIPGLIPNFSTVKDTIYALPESPSSQVLFYRRDLFESIAIQRLYKEQYNEELKPPEDYRSFNQIARFFTKQFNPTSPVEYGTTITLGNSGVAATEFLMRYFSHTYDLFDPEGMVLLDTPTALQSMEELIEVKKYSPRKYSLWWRDTAKEFAEGEIAMTVLFSNYASEMLNSTSRIMGKIGYAPAPGINSLVGGGCIGVCKNSKNKKEALDFIKWVCSDKVSTAMTLLGSVSPCIKTYENYEVIDTYPWLNLSKKLIEKSRTHRTPDINDIYFDERKFLSILGMAVNNVYNAAMSGEEALKLAKKIYEETMRKSTY